MLRYKSIYEILSMINTNYDIDKPTTLIRFKYLSVSQDDLWGNAILLKEANAISVELKKKASNNSSLRLQIYRIKLFKI